MPLPNYVICTHLSLNNYNLLVLGYYPPSDSKEYTEESQEGKGDFLANLCTEWEEAAQLPQDCETREVVVRIGRLIYTIVYKQKYSLGIGI